MRLRNARQQIGALQNAGDVIGRRRIGHARTRADDGEVVVLDVGDREAVRAGRRERERETTGAPSREPFANGVRRRDVEPRSEQQLVERNEIAFGHAAQRRADHRGRAAGHEHDRDVVAAASRARRRRSWPRPRTNEVRESGDRRERRRASGMVMARRRDSRPRRRRSRGASEGATTLPPPPSARRPCRTRRSRRATRDRSRVHQSRVMLRPLATPPRRRRRTAPSMSYGPRRPPR